jgi:hypothetical protein
MASKKLTKPVKLVEPTKAEFFAALKKVVRKKPAAK